MQLQVKGGRWTSEPVVEIPSLCAECWEGEAQGDVGAHTGGAPDTDQESWRMDRREPKGK